MLYEAFWSPQLHETFLSSCISVFFRHSYLTSVLTDRIIQLLLFSWTIVLWLYFFICLANTGIFLRSRNLNRREKNHCHILRGENSWQRWGAAKPQSRRLSPQWDKWSSACKGWSVPGASQLPLLHPKSWQRTPTILCCLSSGSVFSIFDILFVDIISFCSLGQMQHKVC